MAKKSGLGRGLEALIPGGEHPSVGGVITLRVDQIDRNPRQPRTRFDPEELSELAEFDPRTRHITTVDRLGRPAA